jgi:outer membrane protein OmpU
MKSLLASTALLAMSATIAAAEVTLSGDARMGLIRDFGSDETAFTSRARVKFTLSGETDGGLSFGASFRADNASDSAFDSDGDVFFDSNGGGAKNGEAGEVFISGAFGKLSMGDVDGAGAAAVGHVDGVGLTGLGDLNEVLYIANGGTDFQGGAGTSDDPSALYEYSAGDFTGYISATNPTGDVDAYAVGGKYVTGNYTLSLALERADLDVFDITIDHVVLGATATLGAATLKVVYGQASIDGFPDMDQLALSIGYTADALTVTAFYKDNEDLNATPLGGIEAYGLGASYDLGGGASVVGGYVSDETADDDAFDLGLSFEF